MLRRIAPKVNYAYFDPSQGAAAPMQATNAAAAMITQVHEEANLCKICFMRPVNATLVPCGHRFCYECANKMKKECPLCRKAFTQVIKTYDA